MTADDTRTLAPLLALLALGCGSRNGLATPDASYDDRGAPPASLDLGDGEARVELALTVSTDVARASIFWVLDQSESMLENIEPFAPETRWDALVDTVREVTTGLDDYPLGYATFSSDRGGGFCPRLEERPAQLGAPLEVQGAPNRNTATPTTETIRMVTDRIDELAPDQELRRVLVLVTDGEPNGCRGDRGLRALDEAVEAVGRAYDRGLRTYVVSMGAQASRPHFQDMANAGAGLDGEAAEAESGPGTRRPPSASRSGRWSPGSRAAPGCCRARCATRAAAASSRSRGPAQ